MLDQLLAHIEAGLDDPASRDAFLDPADARRRLLEAFARSDAGDVEPIGASEEGRPIDGFVLGSGPARVSLIAGNHADEPVGPDFLRRFLLAAAASPAAVEELLERCTLCVVPHTNPDGEARNASWREAWPDFSAYLETVDREPPGRDVEFGFPSMRPENEAVSSWLSSRAPFALHGSLHGMGMGEGVLLLIERHWGYRTARLQEAFREAARREGLALHDHNRQGEKGFFYLGPGFWTTPEGEAMRAYFLGEGDPDMAGRFHDSSMEFMRGLGGDPLCYVTELPLFVVKRDEDAPPGHPEAYLRLKARLPELRLRLAKGLPIDEAVHEFELEPLSLRTAVRMQMHTLQAAILQIVGAPLV